jgi:uncharacterized protein
MKAAARSLRERLVADAAAGRIDDGPRRYLMMRPDVLMGMLRRLEPEARENALQAFADSVAEHGGDSIDAYFRAAGQDVDALLEATAGAAADLGWGVWRFERARGALALQVADSPFAAGFGPAPAPVCAPINGMLRAVARVVLGPDAGARETRCAASGHGRCEFEASAPVRADSRGG